MLTDCVFLCQGRLSDASLNLQYFVHRWGQVKIATTPSTEHRWWRTLFTWIIQLQHRNNTHLPMGVTTTHFTPKDCCQVCFSTLMFFVLHIDHFERNVCVMSIGYKLSPLFLEVGRCSNVLRAADSDHCLSRDVPLSACSTRYCVFPDRLQPELFCSVQVDVDLIKTKINSAAEI